MVINDLQMLVNGWGEWLARGLAEPLVGALLFALGIVLIVGSLLAGEFIIGVGLGGASLALFFWGQAQGGDAGWAGIALTVIGVALVALEIVVIPGFGLAGISGGVALLLALIVSVSGGNLSTTAAVERAAPAVAVAIGVLLGGGGLALRSLPALARRRGLILQEGGATGEAIVDGVLPQTALARQSGFWWLAQRLTGEVTRDEQYLAAERYDSLVGARGEAVSDLRPGGFALIDGERVDVIARGEVIPAGATVQVIRDEGYRRVVRRVGPDEPEVATL